MLPPTAAICRTDQRYPSRDTATQWSLRQRARTQVIEILRGCCAGLGLQDKGQGGGKVLSVGSRRTGDDLLETNAIAVVGELRDDATHGCADQAVRTIVEVCRAAIIDQLVSVVPSARPTADERQTFDLL